MTSIQVSSVKELYAALSTATGEVVIELAPGTYERVDIWSGRGFDVNFDGPVTIRSADPEHPAIIQQLKVTGASNLVFDNLIFDFDAPPGAPYYLRPFQINNCTGITVKNSVFDGDLAESVSDVADGYATGMGLSVRKGSDILIENNEFFQFFNAMNFGAGSDYTVRGNDVHSLRNDGLTMTGVRNVLIEDNYIHNFERSLGAGDHSDMIQFWTYNNLEATSDILIRNNRLDIGDGDHTQSIFMGNEAVAVQGGNTDMYYQRITIEDNLIINSHSNGIVLGAANDVVIGNNILLHSDGGSARDDGYLELPYIRVMGGSTNVQILDNVASQIPGGEGKPGWIVAGNIVAQNLNADVVGYYSTAEDFLANMQMFGAGDNAFDAPAAADTSTPVFEEELENHYLADFTVLSAQNSGAMRGGVSYDLDTGAFQFDGGASAVSLGKLGEYQDTDEVTFSIGFTLDNEGDSGELFNNHMRFSVEIKKGALIFYVATEDEGLKRYKVNGLDMNAEQELRMVVSLDRVDDHLQVMLGGNIILDDTSTDFVGRPDLHNWGLTLGNVWHDSFEGSINEFSVADQVHFQPLSETDLAFM